MPPQPFCLFAYEKRAELRTARSELTSRPEILRAQLRQWWNELPPAAKAPFEVQSLHLQRERLATKLGVPYSSQAPPEGDGGSGGAGQYPGEEGPPGSAGRPGRRAAWANPYIGGGKGGGGGRGGGKGRGRGGGHGSAPYGYSDGGYGGGYGCGYGGGGYHGGGGADDHALGMTGSWMMAADSGDGGGGVVDLSRRAPHEFLGCEVRQYFEELGDSLIGKVFDWHTETGVGLFRILYPDGDAEDLPYERVMRSLITWPPSRAPHVVLTSSKRRRSEIDAALLEAQSAGSLLLNGPSGVAEGAQDGGDGGGGDSGVGDGGEGGESAGGEGGKSNQRVTDTTLGGGHAYSALPMAMAHSGGQLMGSGGMGGGGEWYSQSGPPSYHMGGGPPTSAAMAANASRAVYDEAAGGYVCVGCGVAFKSPQSLGGHSRLCLRQHGMYTKHGPNSAPPAPAPAQYGFGIGQPGWGNGGSSQVNYGGVAHAGSYGGGVSFGVNAPPYVAHQPPAIQPSAAPEVMETSTASISLRWRAVNGTRFQMEQRTLKAQGSTPPGASANSLQRPMTLSKWTVALCKSETLSGGTEAFAGRWMQVRVTSLRPEQRYQFRLRTSTANAAHWGSWSYPTPPAQTAPLKVAWPRPSSILSEFPLLGQFGGAEVATRLALAAASDSATAAECTSAADSADSTAEPSHGAAASAGASAAGSDTKSVGLDAGDLIEAWSFLRSMDGLLRSPQEFSLPHLASALLHGTFRPESPSAATAAEEEEAPAPEASAAETAAAKSKAAKAAKAAKMMMSGSAAVVAPPTKPAVKRVVTEAEARVEATLVTFRSLFIPMLHALCSRERLPEEPVLQGRLPHVSRLDRDTWQEYLRLCLRCHMGELDMSDVESAALRKLESAEFLTLTPLERLSMLTALCRVTLDNYVARATIEYRRVTWGLILSARWLLLPLLLCWLAVSAAVAHV